MSQAAWADLLAHAAEIKTTHLRTLLADEARNKAMTVQSEGLVLDFCREKADLNTMDKLFAIAEIVGIDGRRSDMFNGEHINKTEDRAVLHVALRAPRDATFMNNGKNVVPQVWSVLDAIKAFSEGVRSGDWKGHTGKPLTDVVAIGIGGSYLGVEFAFEAFKTDPEAASAAAGRHLRFLANVDPIDVRRALEGLSAETTLVIVISKTFTTAETMLNARTVRAWLVQELGSPDAVAKHFAACSTAIDKTTEFGIDPANVFSFWDWVGGRFSLCSAVGVLPLSLQYGFEIVNSFLQGAHDMDQHFLNAPPRENLPMIMGLLAVWNASCLGYEGCAVLPYCQALVRFVAHIQQLDMESSGKRVSMDGEAMPVNTGAIYFGEPGTNGQHSFYQLLHQGRVVASEFIAFKRSHRPVELPGEIVANHDELMSNFFAQPDALALGKTEEEVRASGVAERLVSHRTFPGDRPSLSLILPICNPYWVGQLLALYEHRTAVQGWLWNINSFDQWGVELGKVLATEVREYLSAARRASGADVPSERFIPPTRRLLNEYLENADASSTPPSDGS